MENLGRWLVGAGVLLVLAGAAVWLLGRAGLPLGDLPGDLTWQSESGRTRILVPLGTMLLVSLVLTILLNVLLRLFR